MNCEHLQLGAMVKGSRVEGRSMICLKVWCQHCLMDFDITDNAERSVDNRQLLIEVKPAENLVMDVSDRSH